MDQLPSLSIRQELNLRRKEIKSISDTSTESSAHASKKRNRQSFVCTNCKRKKIKCDRQSPCHNCVKSKCVSSCFYHLPGNKRSKDASVANALDDNINNLNKHIPFAAPAVGSTSPTNSHNSNSDNYNLQGGSSAAIHRQSTSSNGREEGFLRDDVEQLKAQIKNLERVLTNASSTESPTVTPGVTRSDEQQRETGHESILDFKLKSRLNTILRKQSKTQYFGPLSMVVCIGNNTNISRNMVFVRFLEKERQAWKKIHYRRKLHGLNCSNGKVDEEEHTIVQEVEAFFIENFEAICERLMLFKDKINDFMYGGMIDMNIVLDSFFMETFRRDDDSSEIKFIKPEKAHYYSSIALVAALVQCANLFDRDYKDSPYKHLLKLPSVEYLDDFTIRLLNYSRYQRKLNPFSLMTIIILRDNLFGIGDTYTDSSDDARSYGLFQLALHIAFQLGVHRDPAVIDKFLFKCTCSHGKLNKLPASLSSNNSRLIWDYLRQLDGYYSVHIGTPMLINDDYCDTGSAAGNSGEVHALIVEYTNLIREVAYAVNSLKPLSLNDYRGLMDKLIEFSFKVGTFQELFALNDMSQVISLTANRILIKLKLLRIMQAFSNYLRAIFGKVNVFPLKELSEENLAILKHYESYYERLGIKFSYISLCLMRTLTDPEGVFKKHYAGMMAFLKHEMSHLVFPVIFMLAGYALSGTAFSLFCDSTVLSPNIKVGDYKSVDLRPTTASSSSFELRSNNNNFIAGDESLMDLCDIDFKAMEMSIYHDHLTPASSDEWLHKLIRPKQITRNLVQLHATFSNIPGIEENYGLFCVCKLVVILACFMDSIIKFGESQAGTPGNTNTTSTNNNNNNKNNNKNNNNNNNNKSSNGEECGDLGLIIEEARKKIEANMKLGCVDNGFNLEDNNDTIQNWLNTLFNNDRELVGVLNATSTNSNLPLYFNNTPDLPPATTLGSATNPFTSFNQPQNLNTTDLTGLAGSSSVYGLPAEDLSIFTRSLSDSNTQFAANNLNTLNGNNRTASSSYGNSIVDLLKNKNV